MWSIPFSSTWRKVEDCPVNFPFLSQFHFNKREGWEGEPCPVSAGYHLRDDSYWKILTILFLQFQWSVGQSLLICYLKATERSEWRNVFPSMTPVVPATPTVSKTPWGPAGAVFILTDYACSHAHLRSLVAWFGPCSCRRAPSALQLSWVPWQGPRQLTLNLNSYIKTYLTHVPVLLTTFLASRLFVANKHLFIRSGFSRCVLRAKKFPPKCLWGHCRPQWGTKMGGSRPAIWLHPCSTTWMFYIMLCPSMCPFEGSCLKKIFGEHFMRLN